MTTAEYIAVDISDETQQQQDARIDLAEARAAEGRARPSGHSSRYFAAMERVEKAEQALEAANAAAAKPEEPVDDPAGERLAEFERMDASTRIIHYLSARGGVDGINDGVAVTECNLNPSGDEPMRIFVIAAYSNSWGLGTRSKTRDEKFWGRGDYTRHAVSEWLAPTWMGTGTRELTDDELDATFTWIYRDLNRGTGVKGTRERKSSLAKFLGVNDKTSRRTTVTLAVPDYWTGPDAAMVLRYVEIAEERQRKADAENAAALYEEGEQHECEYIHSLIESGSIDWHGIAAAVEQWIEQERAVDAQGADHAPTAEEDDIDEDPGFGAVIDDLERDAKMAIDGSELVEQVDHIEEPVDDVEPVAFAPAVNSDFGLPGFCINCKSRVKDLVVHAVLCN